MSTKIGFIGLGIMGAPMAANLVKAGFEVVGYNRSPARVERLVAAGGLWLAGVSVVHDCSFVCWLRRARGSQARLASVVPVGLYSRLTQPR